MLRGAGGEVTGVSILNKKAGRSTKKTVADIAKDIAKNMTIPPDVATAAAGAPLKDTADNAELLAVEEKACEPGVNRQAGELSAEQPVELAATLEDVRAEVLAMVVAVPPSDFAKVRTSARWTPLWRGYRSTPTRPIVTISASRKISSPERPLDRLLLQDQDGLAGGERGADAEVVGEERDPEGPPLQAHVADVLDLRACVADGERERDLAVHRPDRVDVHEDEVGQEDVLPVRAGERPRHRAIHGDLDRVGREGLTGAAPELRARRTRAGRRSRLRA